MPLNRLKNEVSPYLKQHADNPVDWYPWGDEAFNKAKQENKPILLSIGYSACHWCHVMAHESFSDQETAKLMNAFFINIKVDREERPDLDKIYQTTHYLLTQQTGGWPLTLFLTHDLVPFFSGTYFPKEARYQLPAFKQILQTIADIYATNKTGIAEQNKQIVSMLRQKHAQLEEVAINDEPIQKAKSQLTALFDRQHGGFDGAPKFPQVSKLLFLSEQGETEKVIFSLEHMVQGGLYDQLSGGFFRYTVDAAWQIPHFEKMLYDNALLLHLLARMISLEHNPILNTACQKTAHWCINTLSGPSGFYSSMDADAEGEEGKYYLWNPNEFTAILSEPEKEIAIAHFGLDQPPNVDQQWHLLVKENIKILAERFSRSEEFITASLNIIQQKLLAARIQRNQPPIDNKILTSWNSLMIRSLYEAGRTLHDPYLIRKADETLDFILSKMYRDRNLYAVYADGEVKQPGFLDDYVYLLDALLMSLQIKWNSERLTLVISLVDDVIKKFIDEEGGFYFTQALQKDLLYRPKTYMDEATPSSNGMMLQVLNLLGHLMVNENYLLTAEKLLKNSWSMLQHYPSEHCTLLMGLQRLLHPPTIVILRGDPHQLDEWQNKVPLGNYTIFSIDKSVNHLPEGLASRLPHGEICAYVCQGNQCNAVITQLDALLQHLSSLR